MILYHWTIKKKVAFILREGLDPAFSQGASPVIWLADRQRALSMLSHIATHKGVDPSAMCLLQVRVSVKSLTKWGRGGVWRSWSRIDPVHLSWVNPGLLWDHIPPGMVHTDR